MDKRFLLVATCAALAACAGPSGGVNSKQDLESKGAQRLAAGELRSALTGSRISGDTLRQRWNIEWSLGSDGALNGSVANQYGSFTQTGTWNVTEDGKFCYTVSGSGGPESGGNLRGCQEWYRLGTDHYAVEGTLVAKRVVARR